MNFFENVFEICGCHLNGFFIASSAETAAEIAAVGDINKDIQETAIEMMFQITS